MLIILEGPRALEEQYNKNRPVREETVRWGLGGGAEGGWGRQ